ncbi:hypothetical protein DR85_1341 [Francisella tularensis]|nr:hypothetical protein DR85_1341 [Francisella tularensis]
MARYFFNSYFLFFDLRHLSEQYFTSSHTFAHFLRQVNGKPHTTQIFVGRRCFFIYLSPQEIFYYLV